MHYLLNILLTDSDIVLHIGDKLPEWGETGYTI